METPPGGCRKLGGPATISSESEAMAETPLDLGFERRLVADPAGLFEASQNDIDAAVYLEKMRWPDGITCPKCGSDRCYVEGTIQGTARPEQRICKCRICSRNWSVRAGTFMQGSAVPLRIWCAVLHRVVTLQDDTMAELLLCIGVTERTATRLRSKCLKVAERVRNPPPEILAPVGVPPGEVLEEPVRLPGLDPPLRPDSVNGSTTIKARLARLSLIGAAALVLSSVIWWGTGRSEAATHEMPPIASWFSNGRLISFTTSRLEGEGRQDWRARHEARAAGMKRIFKPDENQE